MSSSEVFSVVGQVIGILISGAGIVTTIIIYIRARIRKGESAEADRIAKEAMDNLQITVTALKDQNEMQAGQIKDQNANIASLAGKVDTLSTIPLAKIEKHMDDTNQILAALLPLIPKSIEHIITEQTTTKLQ